MEVAKALGLLKQYRSEIANLRALHYSNNERWLWKDKVNVVLEAAFGKDSDEYRKLNPTIFVSWLGVSEEGKQREYVDDLDRYERGIAEIVQKYEILGISSVAQKVEKGPPKAFIAHGDKSIALDKLCSFLKALGVEALVVEEQPSKSKAVDDKVEHYMSEADCAIILATGNDEIKGKLYPRQNVIHEIGLAQKTFPDRIIYLLEKGAEFPSNIHPKVWESFTQDCMDEAFIAVARELRAFGLMRATKE